MGYGYGYGYDYNPLGRLLGGVGILSVIALIASIVITVILYTRYAKVPGSSLINLADSSTWGPFLRFETLLIERILKVLYIFNAVSVPLFLLAFAFSAFSAGFGAGMAALVGVIVFTPLVEIGIRLLYEGMMLNVIIARNTSDIKRAMGVADPMDSDGISAPAPSVTERMAYQAPAPTPAPVQEPPTCPYCGSPIKPGQSFCGICGNKLS